MRSDRENVMAVRTQGKTLHRRETASLIGSDKVEGTPVYRSNGERVGQIERIMIDKLTGQVAYAVMSFGGFMGIGEDYYPLPWSLLTYNSRLEGYEVNVGEQQLKAAPKYSKHESWDWSDRARDQKVSDYYGVAPFWGS
jgi:PRC-barrel domain